VGRVWKFRHTTELRGVIRLRMANGKTTALSTAGDTGWRLVRKSKDGGQFPSRVKLDSERSTKQYRIAADMIGELGHAGSVLVVASTKAQAQSLAGSLASNNEEVPALAPLVDFVRQQLGPDHPLVSTLQKGVGFHHAGLPVEVLEALERAVSEDLLPYLTCTSTLTDGVNLPVRTVVLFDQGWPGQPEDSRLHGARLVNAMGRAGRAGRETEGWIVLVRASEQSEQDFADLNPDSDELAVISSLLRPDALESLARIEAELRATDDAIFGAAGAAADFISFVWFMLSVEEARAIEVNDIDVERIVQSTLFASQSATTRDAYLRVAMATRRVYRAADENARLRWPRTGTTVGSARSMDVLAAQISAQVIGENVLGVESPAGALELLGPRLGNLLELPESPQWSFRKTARGEPITVSPEDLLESWMSGATLSEMATSYLSDAAAPEWRIEQMVAAVTKHFEHFLAWTVGALVDLVNSHLESSGSGARVCPELGGFIRYGVSDTRSLQLMTAGIRSRRLANVVVATAPNVIATVDEMRDWLSGMSIGEWRDRFEASSSELLDLVDLARVRRRSLLRELLESGGVDLAVTIVSFNAYIAPGHEVTLRAANPELTPSPLGVFRNDELFALITPGDYADTQAILDTGFALELVLDSDRSLLKVSVPITDL